MVIFVGNSFQLKQINEERQDYNTFTGYYTNKNICSNIWHQDSVYIINHILSFAAFCVGRGNGIYQYPCGSKRCTHFLQCYNSVFYETACGDGLVFNVDAKYCDHRYNVPSCRDSGESNPQNPNNPSDLWGTIWGWNPTNGNDLRSDSRNDNQPDDNFMGFNTNYRRN